MAKKIAPLTITQVKAAKPKEKEYTLSDGDGLLLRIRPNGTKSWMFNYQTPYTKKRVKISFGSFPELSLADAREKRAEARLLLTKNIDPGEHKKAQELQQKETISHTFSVFAAEYIKLKKSSIAERTLRKSEQRIQNYLLPTLGDMPVSQIKPSTVRPILDKLVLENKYETVKRLCSLMNSIMRIALLNGVIEFNPLESISHLYPANKTTHFPSLKPEEMGELLRGLNQSDLPEKTKLLAMWQLHTMTRPAEAVKAMWDEIDYDKKIWRIPAEKMKMKREHEIPLTNAMFDILSKMEAYRRGDYIFPSFHKNCPHMQTGAVNRAFVKIGFNNKTTAHGLRSLASTILNEQGFDPDVIEAALAHQDKNAIRRTYNRTTYLDKRREMMDWWSSHVIKHGRGKS